MRCRAALAATVLLLVACDQPAPTAPTPELSPQFQTGQDRVGVSLSRNAEWFGENQITVHGSFTCPEGGTANFQVNVTQAKPNGQIVFGSGGGNEACQFGSNKWSVPVFGFGWDIGPAVVTVTMNAFAPTGFLGFDSDQGEIHIR
jgi:hypothetical protein